MSEIKHILDFEISDSGVWEEYTMLKTLGAVMVYYNQDELYRYRASLSMKRIGLQQRSGTSVAEAVIKLYHFAMDRMYQRCLLVESGLV